MLDPAARAAAGGATNGEQEGEEGEEDDGEEEEKGPSRLVRELQARFSVCTWWLGHRVCLLATATYHTLPACFGMCFWHSY